MVEVSPLFEYELEAGAWREVLLNGCMNQIFFAVFFVVLKIEQAMNSPEEEASWQLYMLV